MFLLSHFVAGREVSQETMLLVIHWKIPLQSSVIAPVQFKKSMDNKEERKHTKRSGVFFTPPGGWVWESLIWSNPRHHKPALYLQQNAHSVKSLRIFCPEVVSCAHGPHDGIGAPPPFWRGLLNVTCWVYFSKASRMRSHSPSLTVQCVEEGSAQRSSVVSHLWH